MNEYSLDVSPDLASEVARGASHDIRHVLGLIKNYTKLLKEDLTEDSLKKPSVLEALDVINSAVIQGEGFASRLSQLARGSEQPNGYLDLNQEIKHLTEILDLEDVELTFELDTVLPRIHAHQTDIQQILLNLTLNAKEALTGPGKIRFVTSTKDHHNVQLQVIDNGEGMDSDTLHQMMKPFFTTKLEGGGVGRGLGVATVVRLVNDLHGEIGFASEKGIGTTVTILLSTD